LTKRHNIDLRE